MRTGGACVCIVALLTVWSPFVAAADTSENTFSGTIGAAARAAALPVEILTRLLWVESRFHPLAVSSVGAQGVAQFMPGTAAERGLADPFVPEQAIPKAAQLLADLSARFGNIGLGVAAYNAGPGRIARWLEGTAYLPDETQQFVAAITRQSIEDWAASASFDRRKLGPIGCRRSCIGLRPRVPSSWMEHAQMLPILAQSGRPLPALEQSGQPLLVLQRSGQPLSVLRLSGKPLKGLEAQTISLSGRR
jgi:hypothetical protein